MGVTLTVCATPVNDFVIDGRKPRAHSPLAPRGGRALDCPECFERFGPAVPVRLRS